MTMIKFVQLIQSLEIRELIVSSFRWLNRFKTAPILLKTDNNEKDLKKQRSIQSIHLKSAQSRTKDGKKTEKQAGKKGKNARKDYKIVRKTEKRLKKRGKKKERKKEAG